MKIWSWACLLLILFSNTALAIACHKHKILGGYNTHRILSLYGEPEFIDRITEYIDVEELEIREQDSQGLRLKRRGLRLKHDTDHLIPVNYEVWTYIFERNCQVDYLEFRNGILINIEYDSYDHEHGYDD